MNNTNINLRCRLHFVIRLAVWVYLPLVIGNIACSKIDDPYRDFWKDGEKVYPASPDSVKVHPGKNRIELTWLTQGDPSVNKAKIFWNNGKDSLEVPVEREPGSNKADTIKVMFSEMQEGSYSFSICTYDNLGNKSIPVNAVGRVYGDEYVNSLLIRLIQSATYIDDSLRIAWGNPADASSIGSELVYTDLSGSSRHLYVAPDADSTKIGDYDFSAGNTFTYRTLYLPHPLALDTFYTGFNVVRVKGPRVELSRTGWTVTASSFDSRSGSSYRPPQNTIDGNPSSIWVNQISPPTSYPHWLLVDMGVVTERVEGITILVQNKNETPKTVEISVSEDNVNWTFAGRYSVARITTLQYLDFQESQNVRYFKLTAVEPHGNTSNIIVAEVGAFVR
ncbi:MAG: DUF4998 domain-containing protein [Prolixibacteraceae bacterium]